MNVWPHVTVSTGVHILNLFIFFKNNKYNNFINNVNSEFCFKKLSKCVYCVHRYTGTTSIKFVVVSGILFSFAFCVWSVDDQKLPLYYDIHSCVPGY